MYLIGQNSVGLNFSQPWFFVRPNFRHLRKFSSLRTDKKLFWAFLSCLAALEFCIKKMKSFCVVFLRSTPDLKSRAYVYWNSVYSSKTKQKIETKQRKKKRKIRLGFISLLIRFIIFHIDAHAYANVFITFWVFVAKRPL